MNFDCLLPYSPPHPELGEQLGAEHFPGLVKISFLPEVLFVLYSHCSPAFHETICANQPAT
jgi:hypothetical protein